MSAGRRTVNTAPLPGSLATVTSPPPWGTARGEHAALIRELGATPIDYQREDFTLVLPGGFDVVCDGIGAEGYRRFSAQTVGVRHSSRPGRAT